MNWILAAFLMFISSIINYLIMRKLALLKVQSAFINLGMFFIPFCLFLPLGLKNFHQLLLTPYQLLIVVTSAIAFSYWGNKFSINSIALSPNPGYSLIISKSYVILTSVLAVFLFGSELTLKSIFAILTIIIFSALITIDPDVKMAKSDQKWWMLALGAFFCWGFLSLSSKYLLGLGVAIIARLIYVMGIVSILSFWDIKKENLILEKLNKQQIILLVLMGTAGASFNYFTQLGIDLAPNVGYINAINAGSIAAVTVGAIILFKDEFNWRKMAGVLGVTAGLLMLIL